MTSLLAVSATSWGVLMALAPLLQVRLIIRRRSSSGVSTGWPAILLVGFVLWLGYGLSRGDAPLIISNTLNCVVTSFALTVIVRYRERTGSPSEPA